LRRAAERTSKLFGSASVSAEGLCKFDLQAFEMEQPKAAVACALIDLQKTDIGSAVFRTD
jgi:hypothetical protein